MVRIDTVYQRVLALSNKEQRGYVTPIEFNLLANQAQLDIFEQYFYDLDQAKRKPNDDTTFSDMIELINNKLTVFTTVQGLVSGGTEFPINYRTGRIFVLVGNMNYEAKLIDINELRNILNSRFHRDGLRRNPVYIQSNMSGRDIEVYNHNGLLSSGVSCEVINRPTRVEWGYDVIAEKALYNASHSRDFDLHESEETELVYKILTLAGVVIKRDDLTRGGMVLDSSKIQQEKM